MNLIVMKDASELIPFEIENLPISIKKARLSFYDNMQMLCHWHDEVELVKPLCGNLNYSVNGETYHIAQNNAIIVNAKQMHHAYAENGFDTEFLCMVFNPQLLCSNNYIQTSYIDPVLELSSTAPVYLLSAKKPDDKRVITLIDEIYELWQSKKIGFELESIGRLNTIWRYYFQFVESMIDNKTGSLHEEMNIQKNMLQYIYENYSAKITLAQIAQSGEVCRSSCCRIFKKYLNKSPIEFLNTYRLEASINYLRNTDLNITEIAFICGFRSPSYFSETFMKNKGCSPSAYRLGKKV